MLGPGGRIHELKLSISSKARKRAQHCCGPHDYRRDIHERYSMNVRLHADIQLRYFMKVRLHVISSCVLL